MQQFEGLDPQKITEISIEQLVEAYTKATTLREEIEATMSVVKDEIMARLDAENVKGKVVNDYTVSKATRVSFRTSLEWAEQAGAVKKTVDAAKLKALYDSGVEVPDTQVTSYLVVRPVPQKGDAA